MPRHLLTLSLLPALALAACGSPTAPSSPGANSAVQGATATPAASAITLPTEAIVAWVVDDPRPYFDLIVESIAPTGVARPLATLRDVHPRGWADATPRLEAPVLASTGGFIVLSVERDGGGAPDLERTLILRLGAPEALPLELPNVAGSAAWSPGDQLAVFAPQPTLVDPATGIATPITVPPNIDLLDTWAADGSGWLGVEHVGEFNQRLGILHPDGAFIAGSAPAYAPTGRERVTGSSGQMLNEAVSDGPEGAETAIVDFGPGVCPRCIVWAKFRTPGQAPTFGDFVWDAPGEGLWMTWQSADRRRAWLGHMLSPGDDRPTVDLPPGIDLDIVGISPTDAWLILSASDQRGLLIADTLTGETRLIAKPLVPDGPAPIFAGWSSVPRG